MSMKKILSLDLDITSLGYAILREKMMVMKYDMDHC